MSNKLKIGDYVRCTMVGHRKFEGVVIEKLSDDVAVFRVTNKTDNISTAMLESYGVKENACFVAWVDGPNKNVLSCRVKAQPKVYEKNGNKYYCTKLDEGFSSICVSNNNKRGFSLNEDLNKALTESYRGAARLLEATEVDDEEIVDEEVTEEEVDEAIDEEADKSEEERKRRLNASLKEKQNKINEIANTLQDKEWKEKYIKWYDGSVDLHKQDAGNFGDLNLVSYPLGILIHPEDGYNYENLSDRELTDRNVDRVAGWAYLDDEQMKSLGTALGRDGHPLQSIAVAKRDYEKSGKANVSTKSMANGEDLAFAFRENSDFIKFLPTVVKEYKKILSAVKKNSEVFNTIGVETEPYIIELESEIDDINSIISWVNVGINENTSTDEFVDKATALIAVNDNINKIEATFKKSFAKEYYAVAGSKERTLKEIENEEAREKLDYSFKDADKAMGNITKLVKNAKEVVSNKETPKLQSTSLLKTQTGEFRSRGPINADKGGYGVIYDDKGTGEIPLSQWLLNFIPGYAYKHTEKVLNGVYSKKEDAGAYKVNYNKIKEIADLAKSDAVINVLKTLDKVDVTRMMLTAYLLITLVTRATSNQLRTSFRKKNTEIDPESSLKKVDAGDDEINANSYTLAADKEDEFSKKETLLTFEKSLKQAIIDASKFSPQEAPAAVIFSAVIAQRAGFTLFPDEFSDVVDNQDLTPHNAAMCVYAAIFNNQLRKSISKSKKKPENEVTQEEIFNASKNIFGNNKVRFAGFISAELANAPEQLKSKFKARSILGPKIMKNKENFKDYVSSEIEKDPSAFDNADMGKFNDYFKRFMSARSSRGSKEG